MPTTPLCHRTLGHDPHPRYLYDRSRVSEAEIAALAADQPTGIVGLSTSPCAAITRISSASPCIGSACALWVPEVHPADFRRHRFLRPEGDATGTPTGRGVCADNLRAAPFDDPEGLAELAEHDRRRVWGPFRRRRGPIIFKATPVVKEGA